MKRPKRKDQLLFEETTRGPFANLWSAPENGFRWANEDLVVPVGLSDFDRASNPPPWLIHSVYKDRIRGYPPLEFPGLHKEFGKIASFLNKGEDLLQEAIKKFANTWGFLGHGFRLLPQDIFEYFHTTGESFAYWRWQVIHMSALLDLWEMVKVENNKALRKYIKWKRLENGTPAYTIEYLLKSPHKVGIGFIDRDTENLFKYGDVLEPIRLFVHEEINRQMLGHVSPVIFPYLESEIYMRPDCLLSAMYVLFALEIKQYVSQGYGPQLCKGCLTYFPKQHGRQKYCNENCRWKSIKRKQRRKI
jgi:hypothetical protein